MIQGVEPMSEFLWVIRDPIPEGIGTIALPEASSLRSVSGEIVALGPDLEEEYRVGRRAIFGGYAGTTVSISGESYTVLHRSEINALLEAGVSVAPR